MTSFTEEEVESCLKAHHKIKFHALNIAEKYCKIIGKDSFDKSTYHDVDLDEEGEVYVTWYYRDNESIKFPISYLWIPKWEDELIKDLLEKARIAKELMIEKQKKADEQREKDELSYYIKLKKKYE